MAGNPETKTIVSTLQRSRSRVADVARTPDHQRLVAPILAEIDRVVAALDPDQAATVPLTTLDRTVPPPQADIERLRREIERLQAAAQSERGLLDAVLNHTPHGVLVSDAQGKLTLHNRASEKI